MKHELSLAFVVLRCVDLERARQFYAALGLELVAEQHGGGAKHYSATLGSTVLELYPFWGEQTSGLRIGLTVEAPEDAVDAVQALGATVVRVSSDEAIVRDLDGHTVHLVRRQQARDGS